MQKASSQFYIILQTSRFTGIQKTQIIAILKEFESRLQHRPSRNYFRTLIVESQKKVKFLEDVLQKRAEKTKKPTVDVNKEIYCPVCRMTYSVPLTAVLSGSGYVKYFRDDTKHVCPVCHEPEEEKKEGMIIVRIES